MIIDDVWIPKEEMVINVFYHCKARNFKIGMWNGKSFTYQMNIGMMIYNDEELHWDDGAPFGTVKPFKPVE